MDMQIIGKRLRNFRNEKGISQFELEISINASAGSLSRIESGSINPSKETLMKISDALDLGTLEKRYLFGDLILPASQDEINKVMDYINDYFQDKNTLAYILDDRSRFITISKGFQYLGKLEDAEINTWRGELFPSMIINPNHKFNKYIDKDKYIEVLYHAFARTYQEMYFMKDDEYYLKLIELINSNDILSEMWADFSSGKLPKIRNLETRRVYFKYKGFKIAMDYSNEAIPGHERFRLLEYKPVSKVIKILKNFI